MFRYSVVIFLLVFLAGCAGQKSFKAGKSLLEDGSCELAIPRLVESVELALPKGETRSAMQLARNYREQRALTGNKSLDERVRVLNTALLCAVDKRIKVAEQLESVGQLDQGYQTILKALEWVPDSEYVVLVRDRLAEKISRASELLVQATEQYESENWREAIDLAEEAYKLNRTVFTSGDIRVDIRKDGYQAYYKAAEEALAADKREEALEQLEQARYFRSANPGEDMIEKTVKKRNKADELVAQAEQAVLEEDFQQALRGYKAAWELYEERPGLEEAIERTKGQLCAQAMGRARDSFGEDDFVGAMGQIKVCQSVDPEYQGLKELAVKVSDKLYLKHVELAREYQNQSLLGNCWLHSMVALGYRPGQEAQELVAYSREALEQWLGCNVVVLEGNSQYGRSREVEGLIYNSVSKNSPKLAKVLRAGQAADDGVEVDIAVEWQLLTYEVKEANSSRYETSKYKYGTKRVANPRYRKAQLEYDSAVRDYRDAERKFSQVKIKWDRQQRETAGITDEKRTEYYKQFGRVKRSKVDDLRKSMEYRKRQMDWDRNDLMRISMWVEEDDIRNWQYQVFTVVRTAEIVVNMTVSDMASGKVLAEGRLSGSDKAQDEYCPGDAFHNVKEDKLVLPSESQMEKRALEQLASKVNRLAEQATSKYYQEYLVKMQDAREQGDLQEAVEQAVSYLLVSGSSISGKPSEIFNQKLGPEAGLSKWK